MARKQLDAFTRHKAEKHPQRESTQRVTEREFDREATGLPNGAAPAVTVVPCPRNNAS